MKGVRWGFEFLQNGNRLRDHLKRFRFDDREGYGAWGGFRWNVVGLFGYGLPKCNAATTTAAAS